MNVDILKQLVFLGYFLLGSDVPSHEGNAKVVGKVMSEGICLGVVLAAC